MRPLGGGVTAAAAAMAPAAPMAVGARSHLISGVRSPSVRSFARSLESLSPERGASSPQLLQPAAARQQPLLMVANGFENFQFFFPVPPEHPNPGAPFLVALLAARLRGLEADGVRGLPGQCGPARPGTRGLCRGTARQCAGRSDKGGGGGAPG